MLLPSLPIDELRRRVREAESLLRVAKSHARDGHDNAEAAEYASRRITSLLGEVDGLFPGLHEPQRPDPNIERLVAELAAAAEAAGLKNEEAAAEDEPGEDDDHDDDDESLEATADESDEGELEEDGDDDEDENAADDDDEQEWDVDYAKLAGAIENEQLMSAMPEPARSAFRTIARHLIEANERQQLMQRIADGIGELSALAEKNADEARRKAALALTFEELANKRKA
jgi:hypothetical protein